LAKSELLRLAENGIAAYPPDAFGELATQCRQSAEATASPRFFVLAGAVEMMATAWEQFEAVNVGIQERLDVLLATRLPLILSEPDENAATSLATAMREDMSLVFTQGA
jgi:hypothetical protein